MDAIQQEIEAVSDQLVKTAVTLEDIQANIVSEHYFRADEAIWGAENNSLEHHDVTESSIALGDATFARLTFCVLKLRNGFIVTGESCCVSIENFDPEKGRKYARENAIEKIWPLMGYELKSKLASSRTCTCHENKEVGACSFCANAKGGSE